MDAHTRTYAQFTVQSFLLRLKTSPQGAEIVHTYQENVKAVFCYVVLSIFNMVIGRNGTWTYTPIARESCKQTVEIETTPPFSYKQIPLYEDSRDTCILRTKPFRLIWSHCNTMSMSAFVMLTGLSLGRCPSHPELT